MSNPFDYKDPWRPFEGNGYTLNEYEFVEWYGMDVSEYIAECKRRGVEPDRSEPEEYDPQFEVISTNNAYDLSNEEVADNLKDALLLVKVELKGDFITVSGHVDDWRGVLNHQIK